MGVRVSPKTGASVHTVSVKVCVYVGPVRSGDCMPAFCLSVGLRRFPSISQAPLLSSRQPSSYRLAVCPLASSLCLLTWLAFSSGNKGGVQFWAVPGSSSPPPLPSPLPRSVALHSPFPVSSRPLGSERPLPTVPWRDKAGIFGQHPPFSHPLAPIPVPDEASEASLVWAGGSSSPHCLTRIWKLWFP